MQSINSLKRIAIAVGASSVLVAGMAGAALAVTDGGSTSATVDSMIEITAPATFAFGSGVPGDVLTVDDATVNVVSNNAAGYTLSVQASNLVKGVTGTIPATALEFREGATDLAALSAADTNLLLATTDAETPEVGTDHVIDAQLTLPFVESGLYGGTFIFTASNL